MNDIATIINLAYVVAAALFILGLKLLSHPDTAKRGNFVSAVGMLIAVVVTLLDQHIISYQWIVVGVVIGGAFGAWKAKTVAMTAMPEMVSLFNGFGGMASLLLGWAALSGMSDLAMLNTGGFNFVELCLTVLVGGGW